MELRKKFYVALVLYGVIGLLIWITIADFRIPVPAWGSGTSITLRQLTLGVLGLIVLRTVLHWRAEEIKAEREREEGSERP